MRKILKGFTDLNLDPSLFKRAYRSIVYYNAFQFHVPRSITFCHSCMHTNTHPHTCTHARTPTPPPTHPQTHTHTHTHKHTHTHTIRGLKKRNYNERSMVHCLCLDLNLKRTCTSNIHLSLVAGHLLLDCHKNLQN